MVDERRGTICAPPDQRRAGGPAGLAAPIRQRSSGVVGGVRPAWRCDTVARSSRLSHAPRPPRPPRPAAPRRRARRSRSHQSGARPSSPTGRPGLGGRPGAVAGGARLPDPPCARCQAAQAVSAAWTRSPVRELVGAGRRRAARRWEPKWRSTRPAGQRGVVRASARAGGRPCSRAQARRSRRALLRGPGVAAGRQPGGLQRGVPGPEDAQHGGGARPARPRLVASSARCCVQSGSRGGAPCSAVHARSAATISSRVAAGWARGAVAAARAVQRGAAAAGAGAGGEVAVDGAHVHAQLLGDRRGPVRRPRATPRAVATRSRRGSSCSTLQRGQPGGPQAGSRTPKWWTTVPALGQRGCSACQRAGAGARAGGRVEDHSCARGARADEPRPVLQRGDDRVRGSQLPGSTARISRGTPPARVRRGSGLARPARRSCPPVSQRAGPAPGGGGACPAVAAGCGRWASSVELGGGDAERHGRRARRRCRRVRGDLSRSTGISERGRRRARRRRGRGRGASR